MRSPVLFLIFNRPKHTRASFAAIRKARPPRLYIAADGPREGRDGEAALCAEAREAATQVDWPCEVKTLFRKRNLGCGSAVSSAISWFFQNEPEGVILEDDVVPHPDFFPFCDNLLERYRDDQRVMHIGGNNFQLGRRHGEASYYFSVFSHIWGWATWARAWHTYDIALPELHSFLRRELPLIIKHAPAARHLASQLLRCHTGKLDTWDYQWNYAVWRFKGLCITPSVNLVVNAGFDEQGTHTKNPSLWAHLGTAPLGELRHPERIELSGEADDFTKRHVFSPGGSSLESLVREFELRFVENEFAAAAELVRVAKSHFGSLPFLLKAEIIANLHAGNQELALAGAVALHAGNPHDQDALHLIQAIKKQLPLGNALKKREGFL